MTKNNLKNKSKNLKLTQMKIDHKVDFKNRYKNQSKKQIQSTNKSTNKNTDLNKYPIKYPNEKILKLAKDNLKFSSAHFLIFDEKHAERLHGHNYQVQIQFKFDQDLLDKNEYGFCVDFKDLKHIAKKMVDEWDEYILLPHHCKEMFFTEKKIDDFKCLQVEFRDRLYIFPRKEVVLLPIKNTSVELLSELLCKNLWIACQKYRVKGIQVLIEETRGQGAFSTYGQF